MNDVKDLFEAIKDEEPTLVRRTIKDIIKIERYYFYAEKNRTSRLKLKEIRDVIIQNCEGDKSAD